MRLQEILRENIKTAMIKKDSVTKDILRMVLSEMQMTGNASDESVIKAAKKLTKGNTETINIMRENNSQDNATIQRLEMEIKALSFLIPVSMSKEEIVSFINDNVRMSLIKSCTIPQAVGMVMKKIKEKGLAVNGADVKQVLEEM